MEAKMRKNKKTFFTILFSAVLVIALGCAISRVPITTESMQTIVGTTMDGGTNGNDVNVSVSSNYYVEPLTDANYLSVASMSDLSELKADMILVMSEDADTDVEFEEGGDSLSSETDYYIETLDQWKEFVVASKDNSYAGATVHLMTDIQWDGTDFAGIGSAEVPFAGTFDGHGYAITKLSSTTNGLFVTVEGATIQNLAIGSAKVALEESTESVGVLIGCSNGATVENVVIASSKITTAQGQEMAELGGMIGSVRGATTISNSKMSRLTIKTDGMVFGAGGFVGKADASVTMQSCDIANSYVRNTVAAEDAPIAIYLGGVVGWATAPVNATDVAAVAMNLQVASPVKGMGTMAGYLTGEASMFERCSVDVSTLNMTTGEDFSVGGFAGWVASPSIFKDSYVSNAKVNAKGNGDGIGGFVGNAASTDGVTLTSCLVKNTVVSGKTWTGEVIGKNASENSAIAAAYYYGITVSRADDAEIYTCEGIVEAASEAIASGELAWNLNTVNGTVANSMVWSQGNGPRFATEVAKATVRVAFTQPSGTIYCYTDSKGNVTPPEADEKYIWPERESYEWDMIVVAHPAVNDLGALQLTANYFQETEDGVYVLTTDSDYEGNVDNVTYEGNTLQAANYSIKGKITLDPTEDWAQSRILVSIDPTHEHVFAMERVDGTNYQIFTMSKNNEEWWNDWRLISSPALNGNKNSIDFEVIAIGAKIYFLMDDEICYSSDRVNMEESIVKFSSYKNATTTVEGLQGQIFHEVEDVEAYLATKTERAYASGYQAQIDDRYNKYFVEQDCTGKGGTLILGHSHMDPYFWSNWQTQTGLIDGVSGYNVGIGGTTTKDWIYAYDKLIKPFGADKFVISVGENDVRAWGCDGDEVVDRLGELFEMIHADHPEAEIYYIYSLPAAVKYADGKWLDAEYEALVNGEKELCESLDYVQGVDTFGVLVDSNTGNVKTELFGANNDIHLNAQGYQVWSDYVYDEIFRSEDVNWTDWEECKVRSQAPTRYDYRGYASNKGLYINAVQYVDNVITTGDAWTEQTHLEMEIWQHNIGYGWGGTYFSIWPNDSGWTNNNANINEFRCNATVTDRGEEFASGYRYMISYEIYLGFENNVGSADGPYAYVQFKNHMPGETEEGFEYSYVEYRDENRYLYQDKCNSCEFRKSGIVGKDAWYTQVETDYNKELFYQNQGTIQAADPSVITVGDTFYLYGTNASEGLDCSYIRVWSSKNLTDWFEAGYAFKPASDGWAVSSLWAPEVIAHNGKYYMYYSGLDCNTSEMGVGVAVSSSPTGPFRELGKIDLGFPAIDPNPFIDDDGSVYLYVSKDQVDNVSSIYGCKLNADMVTVEYLTEDALVAPINQSDASTGTKYWNEAPHMYKRDGKYYLAFSSGYYRNKSYCLGLATSEEPLAGFSKVSYNPILKAISDWPHVSGTGHCSFFPSPDGKELWVAYHSHVDVENGGYIRQICFDRVDFDANGRMVISGPSVTPQALPSGVSKYKNIASKAILSATAGGNTNLLADGIVNYLAANVEQYEYAFTGENTLTFSFDRLYKVKGIMIYGGADGAFNGETVVVTVGGNTYNMTLDSNTIPGTASILEIDETEANNVTITFAQGVNLSEMVILGEGKETVIESFPELADFSTIGSDLQSVDPSLYNFQMWTTESGLYTYFVQKVPTAKLDSANNWENTHVEMEIWQGDVGYGWGGTYIGLFADETIYINNETNVKNKTLDVNIYETAYGETVIEYYFYLEFDNNLANPQDGPYAYVKQYQHLPGVSTSGLNSQVIERDGRTLITGTENSFQVHATIDAKMNE